MRRMVWRNLILAIAFFDWFFSGFTVLGIDYFFGDPISLYLDKDSIKEGFDFNAWIAKSRQRAKEAFPRWVKEVREIYGNYHYSNTQRFQFDFFYIGTNAKYSVVG